MTDKEIAADLGTRFIRAQFRIASLAAELQMYRQNDAPLPWKDYVQEALDSPLVSHTFQLRIEELLHALDEANPEDLLRILHMSLATNQASAE